MCNTTIEKAQAEWEAEQQRIPQKVEFAVDHSFVEKLPHILSSVDRVIEVIKKQTEIDRNLILTTDADFEQAKERSAQLNKQKALIEAEIKQVKSEYMSPYLIFEKRAKEAVVLIQTAHDNLWSQVNEAKEKTRADKLDKLKTYWEETLDSKITQYRAFTAIADTKWLNKGVNFNVAFAEMDKQYQQIENDLTAIRSLNSEFEISLLEYYKDGHNLGETIAYNGRLQSQKLARETTKAETQANTQNTAEQGAQVQQTAQSDENDEVFSVVFKVEGTKSQLKALSAFMTENGIKFGRA